ncbi:Transcription factor -like protein [Cladobotryum mycophilum]|uniref:Transcription factor -like protein n=1 Tax=Cladobotryum mycophilum TaxID=491253 RepID=A0ABR0SQ49_9HYPO
MATEESTIIAPTTAYRHTVPTLLSLGDGLILDGVLDNGLPSGQQQFTTPPATVTPILTSAVQISNQQINSLGPLTNDPSNQWSSYLDGNVFDHALLDPFLFAAIPDFNPLLMTENSISSLPQPQASTSGRIKLPIQRCWHTMSLPKSSGYISPQTTNEQRNVDESCHKDLADQLQPRLQIGTLPSTTFLNLCIHAYFSNFHPILPIIHTPTFRPHKNCGLLVLSICATGSLFLGSSRAVARGISMWERLHKAMLSSWDSYMTSSEHVNLTGLQAAIIGQTFGLLVGRPRDLIQIQLFHGCLVAWARRLRLLDGETFTAPIAHLRESPLHETWRDWSIYEQKQRTLLAILLHDAQISGLFHHDSILRYPLEKMPQVSSSEAFEAKSPQTWQSIATTNDECITQRNSPQVTCANCWSSDPNTSFSFPYTPNHFTLFTMLEMIGSLACETRRLTSSWSQSRPKYEDLLVKFHSRYLPSKTFRKQESSLMILWHSVFMLLHMDMDVLECACGRDGPSIAQKHQDKARVWAASFAARRCIAHAILVQKHFGQLPIGSEPPIYAAMCLYRAGIAWFCYLHFRPSPSAETVENLNMPEMQAVGVMEKEIIEEIECRDWRPRESSLFKVIDLLQRFSHWTVAHNLASTLVSLVEEECAVF